MKKVIIKVIISVIAIGMMIGSYLLIVKQDKAKTTGTITIEIVNHLGETTSKAISFQAEDTLVGILKNHYDVTIENGLLLKIDTLEALDLTKAFIKIYVNDVSALKGVEQIPLRDRDVIRFEYTLISGGQS